MRVCVRAAVSVCVDRNMGVRVAMRLAVRVVAAQRHCAKAESAEHQARNINVHDSSLREGPGRDSPESKNNGTTLAGVA